VNGRDFSKYGKNYVEGMERGNGAVQDGKISGYYVNLEFFRMIEELLKEKRVG